eukprot:IDg19102t1
MRFSNSLDVYEPSHPPQNESGTMADVELVFYSDSLFEFERGQFEIRNACDHVKIAKAQNIFDFLFDSCFLELLAHLVIEDVVVGADIDTDGCWGNLTECCSKYNALCDFI